MRIVDRNTVLQNMGDTKTVQHFGTLLGEKPHKLGQVVTLYPHLAISTLTDALKNIFYNPKSSGSNYTPINSMAIEWQIDVNFIKKVRIAEDVTGNPGSGKIPFTIQLEEKYYDKNDTLTLENQQQLFVVAPPTRLRHRLWEYTVTLVGNDLSKSADSNYMKAGQVTRYRSNYYPELSERGYTKYTSNTETHRNYISRHRASTSWSSDFAIREEMYIQSGKGKDKLEYFKMNKKEKECLDWFLLTREQHNIFGETNYDVNGKCLDQDEEGRDLPMGDGVIAQIERYCDKFAYAVLDSEVLDDVMNAMIEKSDMPTGNTYAVICNERMYQQFGKLMKDDLRFTNGANNETWFWSKGANQKIKVGAHFDSYTFQGNTITFMPDRALSQEYDLHGYGIFLDTGRDLTSGRPNLAMFTLEGSEMISGNINGMGGQNGKTSGTVSNSLAGSSYHLLGFSGCVLFNPYKSFILEESTVL